MAFKREWGRFIPDGAINESIASWQAKQPERQQENASPSSLLDCPRVVWLRKHKVPPTNVIGWGKKQRFMLGRITEDLIASQLRDEGILLYHWPDNFEGQSQSLSMGEGIDKLTGTPDLLLKLGDKVAISDSKTSRSDSFNYVPIKDEEIWQDPYWYRHKLQLTAYYMLCHANKSWLLQQGLEAPDICHLFSYALDDGIVRRELTWTPTRRDIIEVGLLVRRWNQAYISKEMPACTCVEDGTVKFCPYSIKTEKSKVGTECCHDSLKN